MAGHTSSPDDLSGLLAVGRERPRPSIGTRRYPVNGQRVGPATCRAHAATSDVEMDDELVAVAEVEAVRGGEEIGLGVVRGGERDATG